MDEIDETFKNNSLIDLNEEEKEIYYNRYILFNNSKYHDIEIIFNKFNMYLNLKILSKFSKFFESKQMFEYNNKNDKITINANDICNNHLSLQQVLTWFYFQYEDIIRPVNHDYVSLFYLNDYLTIHEDFLNQIINMIFDVKDNSNFYTKLNEGLKKYLLSEDIIINIHKTITCRQEFQGNGFIINGNEQHFCNGCSPRSYKYCYKYCCEKCFYCEDHCKCKNIKHAIIYILPSLWLNTIYIHKYPIDIINFRKNINQNIDNQKINIDYEKVEELLCEINDQINNIKISINIIFGNFES